MVMASYPLVDSLDGNVSLVILFLGWIPLSGEFLASYPLEDSLGSDASTYPSITTSNSII